MELNGTFGDLFFGNTGTKKLNYDGTNFNFAGGSVVAPELASAARVIATTDNVIAGSGGATGTYISATAAPSILVNDGALTVS